MRLPLLALALLPSLAVAQGLEIRLPDPAFVVSVPDLAPFPLGPHPNAGRQASAKLFGSAPDGVSLSVLTPTADAGTTAAQCASWLAGTVLSRYAPDLDRLQIVKAGDNAWVLLFPLEIGPLAQLKAYVVSGNGRGHCLEVHISRSQPSKEQQAQWFAGFRNVRVRPEAP